jgi:hypothetical protein
MQWVAGSLSAPYRSLAAPAARRVLVVPNNPFLAAMLRSGMGLLATIAGLVLSPATHILPQLSGAEVAMSSMGTVFILVGLTMIGLGVHTLRSRTVLTIDGDELRVSVDESSGSEEQRLLAVPLHDVHGVGLETSHDGFGASYRVKITTHAGQSIAVGDVQTAFTKHQERLVSEIRRFLVS